MAPDGSDRRRLLGLRMNTRPGLRLAWSPDGRLLAYTDGNELRLIRADGSNSRQVLRSRLGVLEPAFSPDGRRIVYTRDAPRTECEDCPVVEGDPEIQTVRVDGTHRRRLRVGYLPTWSPDGRAIAFVTPRRSIATMSPRGHGLRVLLHDVEAEDLEFSPNGKVLMYVRGSSAIEFLNLRSGKTCRLPRRAIGGVIDATWTPDGHHIAYLRAASLDAPRPTTSLFTVTPNGKEFRRIATFEDPQTAGAVSWTRVVSLSPDHEGHASTRAGSF